MSDLFGKLIDDAMTVARAALRNCLGRLNDEYEDIKNGTYRKQKIDIEKDATFNVNEFIDEMGMFTNESNNSTNALTDFHQQNTPTDKPIMTKYYSSKIDDDFADIDRRFNDFDNRFKI